MPDKMERFTQRARRVLSLAHEEAERLHHNYMGSEHMLLGLIREEGGIAGQVLRDLGLDPARVKEMVERLTGVGRNPSSRIELAPGTEQILQMGIEEARRMGHHYIGTEHLLLGMVRQGEGVGMDVLRRLGITPEQIRRQTRQALQETPTRHTGRSRQPEVFRRHDYVAQLSGILDSALEQQRNELARQFAKDSEQESEPIVEEPTEPSKRIIKIIRNLEHVQRALIEWGKYETLPEDARASLERALSELRELKDQGDLPES